MKYYITKEVSKDTVYIRNNYYYTSSNDTIICNCTHKIDTVIHIEANNPIIEDVQPQKERGNKWSVFVASGIAAHDIKSDKYTEPYYKFSPTVHGGITYNIDKQFRISIVGDYTYPAQFLYNAQYIGVGGLAEYDFIKNRKSHLNIGTGLDYSHSYNKRTFHNNNNGKEQSIFLKTDNLYIPFVADFEYDINDFSVGAYLRYRQNIKGVELSNNYFLDGGIQARYRF